MKISKNIRQIISFCIVGGINTITDFAVLNVLILTLGGEGGLRFSIYKSISFIISATNSYFLNKHFTFSYKENSPAVFSKFFIVSFVSLFINVGASSCMYAALSSIHFTSSILMNNISAVVGTIVALGANFFGYKFFVFKKQTRERI